ncbi:odorant receptor 13a-like isoform X2 [Ceratina calcarata]|uniref:Odorant receptor n=1 Tax=Ceratina calcarata TaxID=156304 RepID=A0AAJ7S624_9HYME|nr:odorant receptor 13a-like isoform X2 [Ceratina calcarata]
MNIKNYIFINQLVLKFVGFYPISITRYFICISCIMLIIIPQIMMIYANWSDLNIVMEIGSTLLTILLAMLKSIIWISNRDNLAILIEFMITDYWRIVKADTFKYLEEYATLPIIDVLFQNQESDNVTVKNFPFAATYPTTFYKFPCYEIAYVSQMLATSICCLIMLATDGLIATAVLHTCGHFAVVRKNIQQLDSYIHDVTSSKNGSQHISANLYEVKIQMAHVIKHHQTVLRFCDNMEKNFHPMLFLQTMASSLLICFVGFQVSITLTEQSKMIKFASHLIVAFFQLLLFCFPGDILIRESFSISTAAYSTDWWQLPNFVEHEIRMIILRSQKPSFVTAGKIYVMHLENFTAILSTAFSYFAMLRSFESEA